MKKYVLDANALVRYFRRTPGYAVVERVLLQASAGRADVFISVVNLGEVFYVLCRYFQPDVALQYVHLLSGTVQSEPVDEAAALGAAKLRNQFKLGFADCFAAELATRKNAPLVTADPEFLKLGRRLKVLMLPKHGE